MQALMCTCSTAPAPAAPEHGGGLQPREHLLQARHDGVRHLSRRAVRRRVSQAGRASARAARQPALLRAHALLDSPHAMSSAPARCCRWAVRAHRPSLPASPRPPPTHLLLLLLFVGRPPQARPPSSHQPHQPACTPRHHRPTHLLLLPLVLRALQARPVVDPVGAAGWGVAARAGSGWGRAGGRLRSRAARPVVDPVGAAQRGGRQKTCFRFKRKKAEGRRRGGARARGRPAPLRPSPSARPASRSRGCMDGVGASSSRPRHPSPWRALPPALT